MSGYAQSDAEAQKFYQLAAASNPIAQINLGQMLANGSTNNGTPSPGAAVRYTRMAAMQGYPVGQFNLGNYYRDGFGVALDHKEAGCCRASPCVAAANH